MSIRPALIASCITIGLGLSTSASFAADCDAVRARFQCPTDLRVPLHLSFDDGPALQTQAVLDTLKRERIPASFFIIANKVDCPSLVKSCQQKAKHDASANCVEVKNQCELRQQILQRTRQEGHVVGSHAYEHIRHSEVESAVRERSIALSKQVLAPYLNTQPPLFRLPYGDGWFNREQKPEVLAAVQQHGFKHVAWQYSAFDWNKDNQQGDKILANVMEQVCKRKQGGVVLFHDGVDDQLHEGRLFTTTHLKDWIPALRCVADFKPLSFFEKGYNSR